MPGFLLVFLDRFFLTLGISPKLSPVIHRGISYVILSGVLVELPAES